MTLPAIAALAFMAVNALFAIRKASLASASEYVLAGRRLSGFHTMATMAASNLSAFTVFGVSGAGYRLGWAFFPVMAFGTGFMALSFAVLGMPARRLAAERGWITPGHLVGNRFGSPALGKAFSALSLLYTLPYLAAQAGSGGRLVATVTGLPVAACSAFLVGIIALYVVRGGMRSVVRTDVLQLGALIGLGIAAFVIVLASARAGGALEAVAADLPRAARDGTNGSLGWLPLVGYYLLWSLADPMFPHLTQRFYAARSDRALLGTMAAYPFVSLAVFFPMVAIGVIGGTMVPGLSGAAADGIFTEMARVAAGPVWGPVFVIAALSALMSTMDSQLLACASMATEDFMPAPRRTPRAVAAAGLGMAVLAWLVSLRPPASLLDFLGRTAFPGYASLAPAFITALYFPGIGPAAALASLGAGTALVAAEAAGVLPMPVAFGAPVPAVMLNLAIQVAVIVVVVVVGRIRAGRTVSDRAGTRSAPVRSPVKPAWAAVFAAFLFAATDPWNFGRVPGMVAGVPGWVWYHVGLTALLGVAYAVFARTVTRGGDCPPGPPAA